MTVDVAAVPRIVMFHPYVADTALDRVRDVLSSRWIGQGALVDEFEASVASAIGLQYAVAVNCSSSAVRLALTICGVRPGDEVITTPMTCTLTNHPILEQFGRTVFADIQHESGNIDPADVERRITRQTKAIVCTHWGGQPPDLDELNAIANRHGIPVIEDASEAFGAVYRGRPVGAISRFTAFSFQAIQILSAGEGGMLAVRDPQAYRMARTLRWYGIDRDGRVPNGLGYFDFDITSVGFGYHLTNVAAAIGLENLKGVERQRQHRLRVVTRYRAHLDNVPGLTLCAHQTDRESSNHFFTVHVDKREDFCRMMRERGIDVSVVHYRNDAYTVFGGLRTDLPGLERFSRSYIALPVHMHLADDDVGRIIDAIRSGW
jgi:perosamine synthetase